MLLVKMSRFLSVVLLLAGLATLASGHDVLNDRSYSEFLRTNSTLLLIEFFESRPSCSEHELLTVLGSQSNHITVARVDLATNLMLAAQFMSSELGNTVYGVRRNNQPVIVGQLPCWMLVINGKRVECASVSGDIAGSWSGLERKLVERLWSQVNRWESRLRRRSYGLKEKYSVQTPTAGDFNESDAAAIFSVALDQYEASRRHNWQDLTADAARGIGCLAVSHVALGVPTGLIPMLDDPYRAMAAAHALACFGERAELAVEPLLRCLGKIDERLPRHKEPSPEDWNFENAAAAMQALGAIGPKASRAAPVLSEYARRQFSKFASVRGRASAVGVEQSAGLVASLALASIRPTRQSSDGTPKVRITGSTYHVVSGTQSDVRELPKATVIFWREDEVILVTSDAKGEFEVELEPGNYGYSWTTSYSRAMRTQLFTPDLRELVYFECKERSAKPLKIVASEIIAD